MYLYYLRIPICNFLLLENMHENMFILVTTKISWTNQLTNHTILLLEKCLYYLYHTVASPCVNGVHLVTNKNVILEELTSSSVIRNEIGLNVITKAIVEIPWIYFYNLLGCIVGHVSTVKMVMQRVAYTLKYGAIMTSLHIRRYIWENHLIYYILI